MESTAATLTLSGDGRMLGQQEAARSEYYCDHLFFLFDYTVVVLITLWQCLPSKWPARVGELPSYHSSQRCASRSAAITSGAYWLIG